MREEDPIIRVEGLGKVYERYRGFLHRHRVRALEGVSLTVQRGEILGMLGLNGAGKTTFLKLMLGFIQPTEGKILLFDQSHLNASTRRRIGYLPEDPVLYKFLTVRELLTLCGQLYGLSHDVIRNHSQKLLDLLDATPYANRRIGELSKGMTQRIAIASSLMSSPELVLLDEPLSGLDPIGRRLIKRLLQALKRNGTTVFFSSHILAEVEQICDRVSILHQGKLVCVEDMSKVHTRLSSLEDFFVETIGAEDKQVSYLQSADHPGE